MPFRIFTELKQGQMYLHNGKEVVFCNFDEIEFKARVRDLAGNYYFVDIEELKPRETDM